MTVGKLRIILKKLSTYLEAKKVKEISFDVLKKELNLQIEDVEEILFDPSDYIKLTVDYERSLISVDHVARGLENRKELVKEMTDKVSLLRSKLKEFVKNIDSLLISES